MITLYEYLKKDDMNQYIENFLSKNKLDISYKNKLIDSCIDGFYNFNINPREVNAKYLDCILLLEYNHSNESFKYLNQNVVEILKAINNNYIDENKLYNFIIKSEGIEPISKSNLTNYDNYKDQYIEKLGNTFNDPINNEILHELLEIFKLTENEESERGNKIYDFFNLDDLKEAIYDSDFEQVSDFLNLENYRYLIDSTYRCLKYTKDNEEKSILYYDLINNVRTLATIYFKYGNIITSKEIDGFVNDYFIDYEYIIEIAEELYCKSNINLFNYYNDEEELNILMNSEYITYDFIDGIESYKKYNNNLKYFKLDEYIENNRSKSMNEIEHSMALELILKHGLPYKYILSEESWQNEDSLRLLCIYLDSNLVNEEQVKLLLSKNFCDCDLQKELILGINANINLDKYLNNDFYQLLNEIDNEAIKDNLKQEYLLGKYPKYNNFNELFEDIIKDKKKLEQLKCNCLIDAVHKDRVSQTINKIAKNTEYYTQSQLLKYKDELCSNNYYKTILNYPLSDEQLEQYCEIIKIENSGYYYDKMFDKSLELMLERNYSLQQLKALIELEQDKKYLFGFDPVPYGYMTVAEIKELFNIEFHYPESLKQNSLEFTNDQLIEFRLAIVHNVDTNEVARGTNKEECQKIRLELERKARNKKYQRDIIF